MSDNESSPPMKKLKTVNDICESETQVNSPVQQKKIDFSEDLVEKDIGASDGFTMENEYSNNIVSSEIDKLREFKILDEVKSNDEDSDSDGSESSEGKSEGVPDEEIEKMLEEDLPEDFKAAPKPKEKLYVTRQKILLDEKDVNQFEVLPLDWLMVQHYSGMPVYLHKTTRVCTLAKPYFLGKGHARKHEIPLSAIPCLAYRRALEEEEKQKEADRIIAEQIKNGTWRLYDPNAIIESNNETNKPAPTCKTQCDLETENSDEFKNNAANICDLKNENSDEFKNNGANNICDDTISINIDKGSSSDNRDELDKCCTNSENDINAESRNSNNNVESISNSDKCPFKEESSTNRTEGETKSSDEVNKVKFDINDIPISRRPVVIPGGMVLPPPRVETVNKSWKTQYLTNEQVTDYCKKLFKFKTINIMRFMHWSDRHKYTKARKALLYPTLPEGTKRITLPAQPSTGQENQGFLGGGKPNKRDCVMNMNGSSYLSVFHEYVRRALQTQPVYEFRELENAATPYQATVYIGGMQYGVGYGSSKRQAKSAAARASIHILIPEMKTKIDEDEGTNSTDKPDFSFFDYVGIEDPRITEFCAATMEPSPHAILRTCLLRNFGAGAQHIQCEMKKLASQRVELTMRVGKHTATIVCKNKKTAKQRASQAILQSLHPHVHSWGSLLRLYGSRSVKSCKEKKLEEQQITLLQDQARRHEPNHAVLQKLRAEMERLKERDAAVVPIGTLLITDNLPTHSDSNLNNVEL